MVELSLPQNAWVDIEAAERSITAAQDAIRAGDWKDAWAHGHIALNISGRPFLAGFEAPWVDEVRGELEELQLRARETIAQAGIGLGGSELAGAERSARALIRSAPFRESGYLHLMRALVAAGNTAEALRTFDELRRLLAEELGSAPGAETQALHRRLLGGIEEAASDRPRSDAPAWRRARDKRDPPPLLAHAPAPQPLRRPRPGARPAARPLGRRPGWNRRSSSWSAASRASARRGSRPSSPSAPTATAPSSSTAAPMRSRVPSSGPSPKRCATGR